MGCPVLFYTKILTIPRIFRSLAWIKSWVKGIEVLAVQLILHMPQGLTETGRLK